MKEKSNSEMGLYPFIGNNKTFTTEFRGVRYDYYLTGNIGEAEDYLDLCNILRTATAQDEVVIRIRSGGGQVNTGNMIINAINESEANVIGFIESDCGSMATFIFLACDTWGVSDTAEFFCHTCSYGSWGKEHENFAQAEFIRKQSHKQMRKRYANFLTEDEIETVISGTDIYLDADEIMDRLDIYAAAREAQGCGDPNCEECGVGQEDGEKPLTIDKIVEDAVTRALQAYDKQKDEATKKLARKTKTKSPQPATQPEGSDITTK